MSECKYYNKCKMGPETVDLVEVNCETDEKGNETCGKIEAYSKAFWDYLIEFQELDETNPIIGKVITLSGIEYPIRQDNGLDEKQKLVAIHKYDSIVSNTRAGDFDHAYADRVLEPGFIITLQIDECIVTKCEPTNSFDFYGADLDPITRVTIESTSCQ